MIVTGETVACIDYGNAHHVGPPLSHAYWVGLIHVIAPEIAARLLTTADDQRVAQTAPAELLALGASLYWAWTRARITDYRRDAAGSSAR